MLPPLDFGRIKGIEIYKNDNLKNKDAVGEVYSMSPALVQGVDC